MNVEARGEADATDNIPRPDVLLRDGQRLTLGGLAIDVKALGTGESPAATVYYVASTHTLVVGDILTPRRVPLLAAGRTADWLKQIEILRQSYDASTRVLPGHGPATVLGSAADWQEQYITAFRTEVERATRVETEAGSCITATEGQRIMAAIGREYPDRRARGADAGGGPRRTEPRRCELGVNRPRLPRNRESPRENTKDLHGR